MKNSTIVNIFAIKLLLCFAIIQHLFSVSYAQEYVDGRLVSMREYEKSGSVNSVIDLYQRNLSEIKSGNCAMYPSCSNYGLMVFSEKPFFTAMTLLSDRLVRCSHDRAYYGVTREYGTLALVDYPHYKEMPSYLKGRRDLYTDIVKHSEDSVTLFVNYLINNQDYSSALLEIQRNEFFGGLTPALASKKLLCYRAMDMCEKGIYEYEVLLPKFIARNGSVMFQAARLYYSTGNLQRAISIVDNGSAEGLFVQDQESASVLKAISYARIGDFRNSINTFNSISSLSGSRRTASIEVVERLRDTKCKNPAVARLLSVVPGAGYLYTGHKGSAITSFVINSLLMYTTYTSITGENYGLAGVMGFMSLSFYIGNITGAGRSAIRYNKSVYDKSLVELEQINYMLNN